MIKQITLKALQAGMRSKPKPETGSLKIEQYWYGFVVVYSRSGVALSEAFKTKAEAFIFSLNFHGNKKGLI